MIKENYKDYVANNISIRGIECINNVDCSVFAVAEAVQDLNDIVKKYLLAYDKSNFKNDQERIEFIQKELVKYRTIVKDKKKQFHGDKSTGTEKDENLQKSIYSNSPVNNLSTAETTRVEVGDNQDSQRVLVAVREKCNAKTTKGALILGILCALMLVAVSVFVFRVSIIAGVCLIVIAVAILLVLAIIYPKTKKKCSRLNHLSEIAVEVVEGEKVLINNEEKVTVDIDEIVKVWGSTESYTNGLVRRTTTKGTLYIRTKFKKYVVKGVLNVPNAIEILHSYLKIKPNKNK